MALLNLEWLHALNIFIFAIYAVNEQNLLKRITQVDY